MSDEFKDFEKTPVPSLVFGETDKTLKEAQDVLAQAGEAVQETEQALQGTTQAVQEATEAVKETMSPEALNQAVSETIAGAGGGAAAAAAAAAADLGGGAQAQDGLSESVLSPEERKQVDDFSKQIDITNSTAILQYGAGAQKKMADFSEKALENVRTKDMGEVGNMIAGLVTELQSFDSEESKGIFGFFKKNADKITGMKAKYWSLSQMPNTAVVVVEKASRIWFRQKLMTEPMPTVMMEGTATE